MRVPAQLPQLTRSCPINRRPALRAQPDFLRRAKRASAKEQQRPTAAKADGGHHPKRLAANGLTSENHHTQKGQQDSQKHERQTDQLETPIVFRDGLGAHRAVTVTARDGFESGHAATVRRSPLASSFARHLQFADNPRGFLTTAHSRRPRDDIGGE